MNGFPRYHRWEHIWWFYDSTKNNHHQFLWAGFRLLLYFQFVLPLEGILQETKNTISHDDRRWNFGNVGILLFTFIPQIIMDVAAHVHRRGDIVLALVNWA